MTLEDEKEEEDTKNKNKNNSENNGSLKSPAENTTENIYNKLTLLKYHTKKRIDSENILDIKIEKKNTLTKYAKEQIATNPEHKKIYQQLLLNISTNHGAKSKYKEFQNISIATRNKRKEIGKEQRLERKGSHGPTTGGPCGTFGYQDDQSRTSERLTAQEAPVLVSRRGAIHGPTTGSPCGTFGRIPALKKTIHKPTPTPYRPTDSQTKTKNTPTHTNTHTQHHTQITTRTNSKHNNNNNHNSHNNTYNNHRTQQKQKIIYKK